MDIVRIMGNECAQSQNGLLSLPTSNRMDVLRKNTGVWQKCLSPSPNTAVIGPICCSKICSLARTEQPSVIICTAHYLPKKTKRFPSGFLLINFEKPNRFLVNPIITRLLSQANTLAGVYHIMTNICGFMVTKFSCSCPP